MECHHYLERAILQIGVEGVCAGVGELVVSQGQGFSSVLIGRWKNVSQLYTDAWASDWLSLADACADVW